MATLENATTLYPNTGFLEKTETNSLITPKPGSTMIYTAGCE